MLLVQETYQMYSSGLLFNQTSTSTTRKEDVVMLLKRVISWDQNRENGSAKKFLSPETTPTSASM
eukprot:scaffold2335_cov175-Amphora_coffeaeformis.AAC.16